MSIRDRIIEADDIETETIYVPQWDVTIEVRSMDGRARTRLLSSAAENEGRLDLEQFYPEVVIRCAFDPETGERIFGDDDVDLLLSKASAPLEMLAQAALRVSGMAGDSLDAAGKDSPSIPVDDSSTS